jgi:uncharacterized alkaline shock family protein YloU
MVTKRTKKAEKKEITPLKQEEKNRAPKEICEKTDLGEIKIHENVIGDVVREAVSGLKDVIELEGSSLIDSIAGLVGSRAQGAIGIDMTEEALNIAVKVNIMYGENVPVVSAKVQSTIKDEVKKTLGLDVDKVDVYVQKLIKAEDEEMAKDSEID